MAINHPYGEMIETPIYIKKKKKEKKSVSIIVSRFIKASV